MAHRDMLNCGPEPLRPVWSYRGSGLSNAAIAASRIAHAAATRPSVYHPSSNCREISASVAAVPWVVGVTGTMAVIAPAAAPAVHVPSPIRECTCRIKANAGRLSR
jgi:hypothetical protein